MADVVAVSADGQEHVFPEGTDPSVVDKVMSTYAFSQKQQAGPLDGLMDSSVVKGAAAIGHGVMTGAAKTFGMPGDLFNAIAPFISNKMGWGTPPHAGGSADIENFAGDMAEGVGLPGRLYKPDGLAERLLSEGASGVVGMTPMSKAQAALGAVSGMGGEIADTVMKDEKGESPGWARAVGAIAPLLLGLPSLFAPARVRTLGKDIEEAGGPAAMQNASAAKAVTDSLLGGSTSLTHQLPQWKSLPQDVAAIGQSPEGHDVIGSLVQNDKDTIAAAATRQAQILGAAHPTQDIANALLESGGEATRGAPMRAVRQAETPLYAAASNDPVAHIQPIKDALLQLAQDRNLAPKDMAPITAALKELDQVAASPTWAGQNANIIDRIGRRAGVRAESITEPQNRLAHQLIQSVMGDAAKANSPALAAAKVVGTTGREEARQIEQSALGAAFPENATRGSWSQMDKLFTTPSSVAEIEANAQRLTRADPTAVPTLFAKHINDTINSGGDLATNVVKLAGEPGTPAREAYTEWMKQAYIAGGATEAEATQVADLSSRVMDEIRKVGEGIKTLDKPLQSEAAKRAGSSVGGGIAKFANPTGAVRSWFGVDFGEKVLKQQTFSDLAQALADPAQFPKLLEIAKWSVGKNAAGVIGQLAKAGFINGEPATGGVWGKAPE